MRTSAFISFMAAAGFGLVSHAFAFPTLNHANQVQAFSDPYFSADYDFNGIVALNNCSGSLVRFDDSSDGDKALILTNGHCVKFFGSREVYVDRASSRSFQFLASSGASKGSLRSSKIVYATMYKTDMALYQLTSTYGQIQQQFGVEALTILRGEPTPGDDIEVVSGYWKRGYSCSVEKIVHELQESSWTFEQSIRYSRPGCSVIGGTSGSPVILKGTKTVIAVNNTINESGSRCTMNNPCEVDENGQVTYQKGYGYAQQITWLYDCRDSEGSLDLNQEGCKLPSP